MAVLSYLCNKIYSFTLKFKFIILNKEIFSQLFFFI